MQWLRFTLSEDELYDFLPHGIIGLHQSKTEDGTIITEILTPNPRVQLTVAATADQIKANMLEMVAEIQAKAAAPKLWVPR